MPAPDSVPHRSPTGQRIRRFLDQALDYGFEIVLLLIILYLCISRGLVVQVDIHEPVQQVSEGRITEAGVGEWFMSLGRRVFSESVRVEEVDHIDDRPETSTTFDDFNSLAPTDDPAPHISNLTLVLSPDYGERKGLPRSVIAAKRKRVSDYIRRHAPAARREMLEYGIPASITLAQALLESNAGDSKLAVNSNNHFGIKCRTKCLGCTCRNYGDDTRYDMFRVFDSVAESFREHSILLNTTRYARLHGYGIDYRKWAHGLKACGYATDKRYAEKLITIIENLGLDRYDIEKV
ncbi:glycoside hydrolase family 73 protein [Neolewinella litorea]|uniref:Mannosyl-glycoprotein endo-beta-N-acetylglucosamidase-like domain-containing protein n=1 Tax=Neolewinella litorea TaxID=2562452 RepID=A0A4S4NPJ6_9BACT|nr:glucosaminidase domain-containing protein [Neolewinella litorea]THH41969.1 hypothetical protein E4021_05120 [Neolewinella litorea]